MSHEIELSVAAKKKHPTECGTPSVKRHAYMQHNCR